MHEDPTRRMDVPPRGEPPQGGYGEPPNGGGMSTGAKVAIGILVAAVLGLAAALAVVASDSGGDESTTTSSSTTSTTTSTTTEPTTTSTTEPTTTQPTTTTSTTTHQHRDDLDLDDVDGHRPRNDHRGPAVPKLPDAGQDSSGSCQIRSPASKTLMFVSFANTAQRCAAL